MHVLHNNNGTIPVPEPMAPNMVSAPMHMPPNAAAVGMYLSSFFRSASLLLWPGSVRFCDCSCWATSCAEAPVTEIHVLENSAHDARMNTM